MDRKTIGLLTQTVAFFTGIWIITTIINVLAAGQGMRIEDKIAQLVHPGVLHYITYINAALITVLTVAMFSGFYFYFRDVHPLWSIIALTFLPIYGFSNLVVYLSQILVLPDLAFAYHNGEYPLILLSQLIQDWPGTAMAALNTLSYGILGIPSLIFAVLFIVKTKRLRLGGSLMALSGLLSIAAVFGMAFKNDVLAFMLIPSGIIYFASLLFIGTFFLRKSKI